MDDGEVRGIEPIQGVTPTGIVTHEENTFVIIINNVNKRKKSKNDLSYETSLSDSVKTGVTDFSRIGRRLCGVNRGLNYLINKDYNLSFNIIFS